MKPFFHFVSLFPDTIDIWLRTSILGRAHKEGVFDYEIVQLRQFSNNQYGSVDDVAYGGGGGMVLKPEPLVAAVKSITDRIGKENATVIYFSPTGKVLNHKLVSSLKNTKEHFILICGHYEGVDQRFIDGWVDLEISLGDFVLTGGELPAVAFADTLVRQHEGALSRADAHETESFQLSQTETLLEYPHYTRPSTFEGKEVPKVLLSGDHAAIAKWRLEEARKRTRERRPDLLS